MQQPNPYLRPINLAPPLPNYNTILPLKFNPRRCYYTKKSLKKTRANKWPMSPQKNRISSIQCIQRNWIHCKYQKDYMEHKHLKAEPMAIYKTRQILNTKYPNEPANIFSDYANILYQLNTHLQHSTTHNNHLNKTILSFMVQML